MSSEDEFYDAFEEPDGPPKPAIRLEESSSPEVEEMQRLGIDDEAQSTQSTRSTQSSTLDLDVTTHGEGETTPRLSQYQRKFGTSHPLAALAEGGEAVSDSVSELGTPSVSGTPSEVRTHSVGGSQASVALSMIYEEKSQRPRRVKVKVKKKSKGEFSSMMLIQELSTGIKDSSAAPLFAAKFSLDGNYLAVGGEDGRIRLWKTIIEDTMTMMSEDSSFKPPRMVAIFQQEPIQVLEGHEGSILDLSWSKNNFLLSASMDRTVRLWHFSRSDCLGVFRHPDFVTAVAFHPRDDRIFITGSLDCRLRLWSIADKAVRAWNELPANNFVTAVSFNTSGKLVLAGTATGVCLIFETDGFNYTLQIHVHSRRGKNKIGKKICGIEPMPGKAGDETVPYSRSFKLYCDRF